MSYIFNFLLGSYLIYQLLKFIMRLVAPFLLRQMSNKMNDNFSNAKRNNPKRNNPKMSEGEVSIDKMPKRNKQSNNNIGDYVDYEELD